MSKEELGVIITLLGSINAKLIDLVAVIQSRQIVETLVKEEMIQIPKKSKFDREPSYENTEGAVCFDNLKDVTVIEESPSELAYLIIKDGYQTWLAKSHVIETSLPLKFGVLIKEVTLRDDRKWILGKKKNGIPNLAWEPMGG